MPQHCPTPRELDDLELLTSGAAGPIVGFNEPGSPITLALPDELLDHLAEGHEVELVDPGLPAHRRLGAKGILHVCGIVYPIAFAGYILLNRTVGRRVPGASKGSISTRSPSASPNALRRLTSVATSTRCC